MASSKDAFDKQPGEARKQALQLSLPILPLILKPALELGLLDIISNAGEEAYLSAAQVADQIHGLKNPNASTSLDRMMSVLASFSVLECKALVDGNRVYGITPLAKYFLNTETFGDDKVTNGSLRPMFLFCYDKVVIDSWNHLADAILYGGVAFDRAHGKPFFEHTQTDPTFNTVFNKAMSESTVLFMNNILNVYDGFQGINVLVDVGGGTGANLNLIMSRNPTIGKGVNLDLPHIVANAPIYPGIEHVGGDMFNEVPKGDVILVERILHSWSDEHCLKLLSNCWKALPDTGKVIVVEWILRTNSLNGPELQMPYVVDALQMLLTSGGKGRTEQEYNVLAKSSGFSGFKATYASGLGVMEFHK